MYSNIGITEQGFWLIKRFFYNRNRWSNSGPDDFEVGLKPGLRSRSRKEWEVWGEVGFLTTLGVGFFCPSPDVQLDHFLNHILKLGIPCWNGIVSFETFVETEISCCAPRLPLIVAVKFHSLYVEESESGVGFLERLSRSSKFWDGWSWSRIFFLTTPQPCLKRGLLYLQAIYQTTCYSWENKFSQRELMFPGVGPCWLAECVTGTFWLTDRDSGTKP